MKALEILKNFLSGRLVLVIGAFLISFALNGFTDIGKSVTCAAQAEQCLTDAIKKVNETSSADLAAVAEKSSDASVIKVKTVDGNISVAVPTSDTTK